MPNGPAKIDQATMRRMWLEGVRTGVIAAIFGCKSPAVSRLASRLGLPKRNIMGVPRDAPKPPPAPPKDHHHPPYLSKPETDPPAVRLAPRYTYAVVQELVATRGMTQRQALAEFHKRGRRP